MQSKYSAKSDLYRDFVLCVKFQSSMYMYDELYEGFYESLVDKGWVRQTSLGRIEDDIIHRYDDYLGHGQLLINSDGEEIAVLQHETGAEVWIISIATFVAGAIASGIIGNAAYDLIRKLYVILSNTREESSIRFNRDDRDFYISVKLRTPDYETIEFNQLTVDRQRELIQHVIENRLQHLGLESQNPFQLRQLEKRMKYLEEQLKAINSNYIGLANEFQRERVAWRSRNTYLSQQVAELIKSTKRSFIWKVLGK